jgi:tape measure domain-containing protein
MSNSIDTRIVEMKFNNSDFARGVASTLKDLDNLKKGMKLDGVGKGLEQLNTQASHINLGGLQSALGNVTSKLSTMGIVGVAALASIAVKGVQVGAQLVNSLALGPLKDGLAEYETNLNSIQTILANTGLEGKKGLQEVNGALQELNTYSDKTIYNFSEMAKNIGTFTAAGIDLDTSTAAIKGIANLAAISGSNAEQASSAMYQLSQAMAAGKATLVDWNSVVNAGMGGKVFQEALKDTARAQGVAIDNLIKKNGSFRDSLQEGWLTTKVLTGTLQKFTGDMNAQQLKSLGYTDKQIAAIIKMGKTAQDAATKVKTVSQLIGTLREAAGSGWSQTFQLLFGDFEEARTLFTNVSNVLGGFIQSSSQARNKVLGDWKALGGRTVLIKGIALAFNNVMEVLTPIKKAFRDIFPPATGKQLFALTQAFTKLMSNMRLGEDTMNNIRRTFRGLFAAVDIGIQILKGIGNIILTVFRSFSDGSSGLLEFTGNVGDWIVKLDQAIKSGTGFQNFFKDIGKAITVPIKFLKAFLGTIKDLISGLKDLNGPDVGAIFTKRFSGLKNVGGGISKVWSKVLDLLKGVFKIFEPLMGEFSKFFDGLGDKINEGFSNADYNGILDGINTGLLAGLVLLFKKFLAGGINIDLGGGVLDTIKDSFEGLTGVMSAMQAQLKAGALIKIAGAIALLTASVVALSLIDSGKLTQALTGLSVMFVQLLAAMAIFEKIAASSGFLKMPALALSLIGMAIAIDLLTIAVSRMADLNWEELAKGLTGTAVLLGSLALFTKFSSADVASGASLILLAGAINLLVRAVSEIAKMSWAEIAKGLAGTAALLVSLALFTKLSAANKGGISQGAGLLLLALGIKVLAGAMEDLGKLTWGEIARGLVTMAGGLTFMGLALALIPPSSILSAAGIFIVASSLSLIGDAVKQMGGLSWSEIGKGLLTMGVALGAIALAIGLLPPSSLLSAAAVFVVAASLGMIADALGQMGGMSWSEIAKSLVLLAGSLTILAAAMYLMTGALPGAAATLVVAAALKLLTPVLQAMGGMSWGEIAKGLVTLAGVFLVLGVAGLVLGPLVPVLIGLGIAIGLLGVGMLAAGGGMALFGIGLTAVAASGAAAVAVLIGAVRSILNFLPEVATSLGALVTALANAITKAAPAVVKAIVTVLLALLAAIDKLSPKIVSTLGHLLELMLAAMLKYIPKMADAGLKILIGILNAIANNIGKVVKTGTDVVVNFLKGITQNQNRVIDAGVEMVIGFVNGVANSIRQHTGEMNAAGANLADAIISGMVGGLSGGIGVITSKAKEVASSALSAAKGILGINSPSKEFEDVGKFSTQGLANGLVKYKVFVTKAAEGVGTSAIETLRSSLSGISDIVATDANFTPVIRPVLDLTDVKKTAAQIGPMVSTKPIKLETTSAKARDASAGYSANRDAQQEIAHSSSTSFEYTQINNSPKALSRAEIYRNTKNQLSTVKGALDNADRS